VSQLLPRLGWNDGWDGGKDAVDAWGHNDLGIGDCQDDEDENQQALQQENSSNTRRNLRKLPYKPIVLQDWYSHPGQSLL
jgi:hypothetical protein